MQFELIQEIKQRTEVTPEAYAAAQDWEKRIFHYYPGYRRDWRVQSTYYNLAMVCLDFALLEMRNPDIEKRVLAEVPKNTYNNSFNHYFIYEPAIAVDQHTFANVIAHQMQFFDWVAGDLGLVGEVTPALPLIREFISKVTIKAGKEVKALYRDSEDSVEKVNSCYRNALEKIWDFAKEYEIAMPVLDWERFE